MNDIDFYINEVQNKKIDGGEHRTKAYPFVSDGLILINKYVENFEELKNRIQRCRELGINIPLYIDYKEDDMECWLLEELAKGSEYASLVKDEDMTEFYATIPYEHMEKYVRDCYLLEYCGIGIEPRYRNIFYDRGNGFTNIDVGLYNKKENNDSLIETYYFFNMVFPVFSHSFKDDSYGRMVQDRTILNIMKAFENGHPFFNKFKRWIYRNEQYFANFLENKGYDLCLDEKEYEQLIEMINQLIEDTVNEKLNNPSDLFVHRNYDYIRLLESSIAYCKKFDLFDKTQKLEEYIDNSVYSRIKSMFLEDSSNDVLKTLYFKIRRNELDPVGIYPEEYINKKINEELEKIISSKHMN